MNILNNTILTDLLQPYLKSRFNYSINVLRSLQVKGCWLLRGIGYLITNLQYFFLIRRLKIIKMGSEILEWAFRSRKNVGFEGSQCTGDIEGIKNLKILIQYTGYPQNPINIKNLKIDVEEKLSTLATPKIKNLKNLTNTHPQIHLITINLMTKCGYLLRNGLMAPHEGGDHRKGREGYKLRLYPLRHFLPISRPKGVD